LVTVQLACVLTTIWQSNGSAKKYEVATDLKDCIRHHVLIKIDKAHKSEEMAEYSLSG